jgi:SAM-dependent MidA family methyltransferase
MELALYCPDYGYYEKEADSVGRAGDFYTSVSVGPLFGELLAFQFSRWIDEFGDGIIRCVEAGSHDGRLAADILGWFQRQRPDSLARMEYCILEPSERRREWQRRTLSAFSPRIRWVKDWNDLLTHDQRRNAAFTISFSNELLDAFPIRRLGWDAARREWFEWGVATDGDAFTWSRLPLSESLYNLGLPEESALLDVLPDGFTVERSPAAEAWWKDAAQVLGRGVLLAFDYGYGQGMTLIPERPNGTLRGYRHHKQVENVLADPGLQDITAHVDFGRIETAGIKAGLGTELFEPQGRFLTQLASKAWQPDAEFGKWDSARTRQFQTLIHPQHLGVSFHVLIQSRK